MWRKNRLAAFTLIEALVALLVISLSLLLFQNLTGYVSQDLKSLTVNQQRDWLLFTDQLEEELEGSQLVKVEDNRLYFKKGGKVYALGQSSADDFRKTNQAGKGYQPMVFHLKESQISQEGDRVYLSFQFEDGLERNFIYAFS